MFTKKFRDHLHRHIARALEPLARRLSRIGVSVNQVTIAGSRVNLAAGVVYQRPASLICSTAC